MRPTPRRSRRLAALLAPALAAAGLALPASAGAKTFTADAHGLSAKLVAGTGLAHPPTPVLTVTGSTGAVLFHGQVTNRFCASDCVASIAPDEPAVQFADLAGPGLSPDLLVNFFSGGASCCFVSDLLTPSAALGGQYVVSLQHNFGSAGFRLRTLSGHRLFDTADNSFAGRFTDVAASGLPVRLLALQGTTLVNVTRYHSAVVNRDANRWLTAYRRAAGRDDVGFAAAYAADEAELGYWHYVHTYLVRQARAGALRPARGLHAAGGMRFVRQLTAFLRRGGYLK